MDAAIGQNLGPLVQVRAGRADVVGKAIIDSASHGYTPHRWAMCAGTSTASTVAGPE